MASTTPYTVNGGPLAPLSVSQVRNNLTTPLQTLTTSLRSVLGWSMISRRHLAAAITIWEDAMGITKTLVVACTLGFASLGTAAVAQQLPKSGTINIHTGFKVSPEAMDV